MVYVAINHRYTEELDDYNVIMVKAIADRLAEVKGFYVNIFVILLTVRLLLKHCMKQYEKIYGGIIKKRV